MQSHELIQRIRQAIPDAEVTPQGEGCNFHLTVVSASFAGEALLKRHRKVMASLEEWIQSGELHAVTLKTYTPDELRGPNHG